MADELDNENDVEFDEEIQQAIVLGFTSLAESFITEDGSADMVGLAGWFVQIYKEFSKPTLEDWENLEVTLENAHLMFKHLVAQEIEQLKEE